MEKLWCLEHVTSFYEYRYPIAFFLPCASIMNTTYHVFTHVRSRFCTRDYFLHELCRGGVQLLPLSDSTGVPDLFAHDCPQLLPHVMRHSGIFIFTTPCFHLSFTRSLRTCMLCQQPQLVSHVPSLVLQSCQPNDEPVAEITLLPC